MSDGIKLRLFSDSAADETSEGVPWPAAEANTVSRSRQPAVVDWPERTYQLRCPRAVALPAVQTLLAELATDLSDHASFDSPSERSWWQAGLEPAEVLWASRPALLADLLQETGLVQETLEAMLLAAATTTDRGSASASPRQSRVPATVWLDPRPDARVEPATLVLSGRAWTSPPSRHGGEAP